VRGAQNVASGQSAARAAGSIGFIGGQMSFYLFPDKKGVGQMATERLLEEYSKNGVHPQKADSEFKGVEIHSTTSNSPGSTFCSVNCDCR